MIRWLTYILIISGLILGLGTFLQMGYTWFQKNEPYMRHPKDDYDPALGRLNNMSKLVYFVDSIASSRELTPDSIPDYVNLADSIIRMRFYHGLQNYRFADNFIANLMGKYIWYHIGAKVIPDDILKGSKAYCSQSSIVFQEFLIEKGFDVRSVLLPGHFCTEVLVNGNWQFHDVSFKPSSKHLAGLGTDELLNNPLILEKAYLYSFSDRFRENLHNHFDARNITFGEINSFAAPRMALFHRVTCFLSWWGWLVFLGLAFIVKRIIRYNYSNKLFIMI
jgi:hypothetical protein